MKRFLSFSLSVVFAGGFLLAQHSVAQSLQEIQEYCQSMNSAGINDEDARLYIEECINEQKSYLDQDSENVQDYAEQNDSSYDQAESYSDDNYQEQNYEQESYQEQSYEQESYAPESEYQEQNCYTKVDEQVQKLLDNDPNSPFDYDQMIEQCLKGNP